MGTLLAALVIYQGLTGQTLTALPAVMVVNGSRLVLSPEIAVILLQASQEALRRVPHVAR